MPLVDEISAIDVGGMKSTFPNKSYGARIGPKNDGGRGLLKFLLTTPITGGGEITKIEIGVKVADVNYGPVEGDLHLLDHYLWVGSEACWNEYSSGNSWNTPGGDFNSAIIDSINIPWQDGENKWYWWTVLGDSAQNPISWEWGETKSFLCKASNSTDPQNDAPLYSTGYEIPKVRVTHEAPIKEVRCDTLQVITNRTPGNLRADLLQIITNSIGIQADTVQNIQGPEEQARADTLQRIINTVQVRADTLQRIRTPFFLPRLIKGLGPFMVVNNLLENGILKPIADALDEFRALSKSLSDYGYGDHDEE